LDYKLNILSDYENEVDVKVDYDDIQPEIQEAYNEERKNLSHPGFRKGKVPLSIIKKLYGEAIEYKASEKIANKKFWDLVDEQKLKPISTPVLSDIKYASGEKLEFKVKFEVKPEITLKDYTGLEIDKPIFKVKDEDLDLEVKQLMKSQATFEEAEVVEDENFRIQVDLQKLDDNNEPVIDQRSEGIMIDLGDEKVNPQIRLSAQGKKNGEDFNFEFVDEHQHGDHTHKETFRYTATITKIEKMIIPEPDEEFIKKVSKNKAASLDELKNYMKENYEKYYDQQSESAFVSSLLDKVVKNNDFTAPPGYVEMLTERMAEAEIENAKRQNRPSPDKSILIQNLKARAEWNAKWQIILEKLSEVENIVVEDADIEKMAEAEAEKTGISVEKLVKFYKDSNRTETFLEDKVIEFLKEKNTINEIDAEELAKKNKEKSDEN
jgi:trigger factor